VLTIDCRFANLPGATQWRWGQGITSKKMEDCRRMDAHERYENFFSLCLGTPLTSPRYHCRLRRIRTASSSLVVRKIQQTLRPSAMKVYSL
jgi:hypothetical protein